jgi:hypothetical protein
MLDKHVSMAKTCDATIEELLEMVLSIGPVLRLCKENQLAVS